MPRVEVTAEHHDFGSPRRIGSRHLGDDIEAVDALHRAYRQRQRNLDGLFSIEHADDAPVVLARDDEAGIRRVPDLIVEAVGPHVLADGTRGHERRSAFPVSYTHLT